MGCRDISLWVNGSENLKEEAWAARMFEEEKNKDKANGHEPGTSGLLWRLKAARPWLGNKGNMIVFCTFHLGSNTGAHTGGQGVVRSPHLRGGRHVDEGAARLSTVPVSTTAPWTERSGVSGQPVPPGCWGITGAVDLFAGNLCHDGAATRV